MVNKEDLLPVVKGRGSRSNPANRFEKLHLDPLPPDEWAEDIPAPATEVLIDSSRSILARNQSPDVGFDVSLNPYRGCEHGCSYCYARPSHEYLGFSAGLDFETRILVKTRAAALLREELAAAAWKPQVIALSGVTDPYQPVERRLAITRDCLAVLSEFRNPVCIITKSFLVARDRDLLSRLAQHRAAAVNVSVTSLRDELQRRLEPRASSPSRRLAAIRRLSEAGVPVRVLIGPVVPGLTDEEIPAILEAASEAGATAAGWILLRLPYGVRHIFVDWLHAHYPERVDRVLNRISETRSGRLNAVDFGERMRGRGEYARHISSLFHTTARRLGLQKDVPLSAAAFRVPGRGRQDVLF